MCEYQDFDIFTRNDFFSEHESKKFENFCSLKLEGFTMVGKIYASHNLIGQFWVFFSLISYFSAKFHTQHILEELSI